MDKLRLEIPRQTLNPTANALAHPARLKGWLAALPLGNANKTGHELLAALHPINRATVPVNHRYALLEEARPLIATLLDTLHKQYTSVPIPLGEKPRAVADMMQALLLEMAYGYKAVILELVKTPNPSEAIRTALVHSAYQTMAHLSRLLVERYAIYAVAPKNLWLEVNQLYRYAERNGFHTVALGPGAGAAQTLDNAYRRLLLLALANPYHLMQGEALRVYQELEHWSAACRLQPLAPAASIKGLLFIDLDGDGPPRYAPSSIELPPPVDGRVIDISAVLGLVEQRIKEVLLAHKSEANQLTLMGRKLRNMYKRLAEAWGIRSERLAERRQRDARVDLAVGISACHYFTSNGSEFAPETSEVNLLQAGHVTGGHHLSLMATDDQPWLNEEHAKRIVTSTMQPRTSYFAPEKVLNKDVWVKVYSTQAMLEFQKSENLIFENISCQLVDESRSGLAVECDNGDQVRMNVGEVVAFRNEAGADWSVGTIRWLRVAADDGLDLGIRALAEDALAVAVRGIRGTGKGGEYFRALLIPRLDPVEYPTTLIIPAAIFDVDSIVLVNTGQNLLYAHLTKLMDATDTYSLFQFQVVAPPDSVSGPAVSGNDHWIL